jgi:hypothetical protein
MTDTRTYSDRILDDLKAQGAVEVLENASTWSLTATATAAAATVTRPAEAGRSHYVTSISGGFGAAQIALLTLSDGATVIGNFHVHNQRTATFDKPLKITGGNAAGASLGAGAAGVVGAVTLTGYTV